MKNYLETVYAGLLGKIIGVYLGRPFEGWTHREIKSRFGEITDYAHEQLGKPLVVSDDDISGTITFARAVKDSNKGKNVDYIDFGNCWLNYLIENETVLWWGGFGISTEHTAYARLKDGIMPPLSGSIEMNGQITAEQIGAQIFIDAFGLMAPNQPDLAAALAEKAAKVSHDGEAVHAAKMVAVMISLAFEIKDIDRLMDQALTYIPKDCLLAQVYEDVRSWCAQDATWYETFAKIEEKYGYDKFYGGNCHVIPNHAIMIMAWLHGKNDFSKSQLIINTAGWDTDCNAANVGSLMGVILGYKKMMENKDWQKPFADLIFIPTADCSSAIADVAIEAKKIALVGKSLNTQLIAEDIDPSFFHDFQLPGALHGYKGINAEIKQTKIGSKAYLEITPKSSSSGAFSISHLNLPKHEKELNSNTYRFVSMPFFYPCQTITISLESSFEGMTDLELVLTTQNENKEIISKKHSFQSNQLTVVDFTLPPLDGDTYQDYKFEFKTKKNEGHIKIYKISWDSKFLITGEVGFKSTDGKGVAGWVTTTNRNFQTTAKGAPCYPVGNGIVSNSAQGLWVTGHLAWTQLQMTAIIQRKVGTVGLVLAYQGLSKFLCIEISKDKIKVIEKHYQDLDEKEFAWESASMQKLNCSAIFNKGQYDIKINDFTLLGQTKWLNSGAAGFSVEKGTSFIQNVNLKSLN